MVDSANEPSSLDLARLLQLEDFTSKPVCWRSLVSDKHGVTITETSSGDQGILDLGIIYYTTAETADYDMAEDEELEERLEELRERQKRRAGQQWRLCAGTRYMDKGETQFSPRGFILRGKVGMRSSEASETAASLRQNPGGLSFPTGCSTTRKWRRVTTLKSNKTTTISSSSWAWHQKQVGGRGRGRGVR